MLRCSTVPNTYSSIRRLCARAVHRYIPEAARGTVCLSSQCGCSLACSFCHTGTQKITRNLTSGEIVGQLMTARHSLGDFRTHTADHSRAVSNIGATAPTTDCPCTVPPHPPRPLLLWLTLRS
jgi:hypothetical protein